MLSIIMPVYNAAAYLDDTVASVLAQTYTDFELILVDDGSDDGSGELCDMWAQRDARIRVIHKPNGGVAAARNAGLNAARGDYIGWVDSDDLIVPFMFETMMALAEQYNGDIVQCGHVRLPEKLAESSKPEEVEVLGPIDSLKRIYRSHYTNSMALWSKIYRAKLFEGLRFTEGTAFEDDERVPQLLYRGKRNVFCDLPMYCYVKREQSIITAPSVKNIMALTQHRENRMLWFRQLDEELYELECGRLFAYLKGKCCESIFLDTPVQEQAQKLLQKYTKVFWRIAGIYDKMSLLLLRCGKHARKWVARNEFAPIQKVLAKLRN